MDRHNNSYHLSISKVSSSGYHSMTKPYVHGMSQEQINIHQEQYPLNQNVIKKCKICNLSDCNCEKSNINLNSTIDYDVQQLNNAKSLNDQATLTNTTTVQQILSNINLNQSEIENNEKLKNQIINEVESIASLVAQKNEILSKSQRSIHDSGEESEEENEVIEESPNGRWSKRKKRLQLKDVPGVDKAYVAMDTENGYEVVWNEIYMSEKRIIENKLVEEELTQNLDQIFKNLVNINHPNIVKFHDYWRDVKNNQSRIIFITEYMSTGSLKQFLRKAKKTNQPVKTATWQRWCVQLITALHYLHNCEPPIIHRELSCDSIFIQQNGLIKIGSISLDIVQTHVRMRSDVSFKNSHFVAPEMNTLQYGTPVDIYSFGMIALEMSNIDLGGNGDTHTVTPELIKQTIETLEDENQKDFISMCLKNEPNQRPTAYQLLSHPLLYAFYSLKFLSAHKVVKCFNKTHDFNLKNYMNTHLFNRNIDDKNNFNSDEVTVIIRNAPKKIKNDLEDLNKYFEDVKSGLYPWKPYQILTKSNKLIGDNKQDLTHSNVGIDNNAQPDVILDQNSDINFEKRKAQNLKSSIITADEQLKHYTLIITMKFEDKTSRHLEACIQNSDTAESLANELINCGLINEFNKQDLLALLDESLKIRDDKIEDKDNNSIKLDNP